ncbi:Vesicle membrane receptor protein (v-SNARE) [Coemansia aciculifera]|nr:Vesicle membrane receptor protein (v-SNARE) [Coemansia aciculifera]
MSADASVSAWNHGKVDCSLTNCTSIFLCRSYNTNPGHLESGYGGGKDDKGLGSKRYGDDAPKGNYGNEPHSKGQEVQQEVDKVVGIMNENIQMVMARGENLDDLYDRTGQLNEGAAQFRRGAAEVRKTMWWRNMRLRLILAGVVVLLIIIIVGKCTCSSSS